MVSLTKIAIAVPFVSLALYMAHDISVCPHFDLNRTPLSFILSSCLSVNIMVHPYQTTSTYSHSTDGYNLSQGFCTPSLLYEITCVLISTSLYSFVMNVSRSITKWFSCEYDLSTRTPAALTFLNSALADCDDVCVPVKGL